MYEKELAERPMMVAGSKIDLATDEQLSEFRQFIEGRGLEYFEISAPLEYGTKELIGAVAAKLSTLPKPELVTPEPIPVSAIESRRDRAFTITERDGVFMIDAEWLAKIVNRTDFDDFESAKHFEDVLERTGIIDELKKRGVKEGDTVSIYELEFTYVP